MLRMDTVPKFVQLIKQVQQEVGVGRARARPPRMEVVGAELEETRAEVRRALAARPSVRSSEFPG
jgi:4-hydroxy-tetrahydrodipicolinate synthase